jgi:pyruvate-ferredoxin/flavodoxin oxidoreductase
MIPYCTNHEGRGPAWGNSLFEDNAEYGFGMARAYTQRRRGMKLQLETLKSVVSAETGGLIARWIEAFDKDENPEAIIPDLEKALKGEKANEAKFGDKEKAALAFALANLDLLVKSSYWIVGGDGWAYDIDYGGLDHVVAMGANVNVVVLDTEMYSNTGGQRSKATNLGAIAKFASGGNRKYKKDLGQMFMSYGDVYVASVSIHADPGQAFKAFKEAESYPGTSVILCYCPCKEHGFPLAKIVEEATTAIKAGYWPLYRYDPRKPRDQALTLDSKESEIALRDFLTRENRYAALVRQNKEVADDLFGKLEASKKANYERLVHQSQASVSKAKDGLKE